MKRFWLVLVSLGLVMAFSVSAYAVDVKFSGSYYAAGIYLDKTSLVKNTSTDNVSTAFYYQRLRLQTDFVVSPGLKLVARADVMERIWGGVRSAAGSSDAESAATRAENENIAFDWLYIDYASPIGAFLVGYMQDNVWGTVFGDNGDGPPAGIIKYILPIGPVIVGGGIYKEGDKSYSAVATTTKTDNDSDKYVLFGIWNINKDVNIGLLYSYSRIATSKPGPVGTMPFGLMTYVNTLQPYAKAKFGPVYVEAEVQYAWGKTRSWEDGLTGQDVKLDQWMAYAKIMFDPGMFYVGLQGAYIMGDDPGTTDKQEGGVVSGGVDWNPCLLMFNQDITYWVGPIAGYSANTVNSSPMGMAANAGTTAPGAWFGQVKGGVRPVAALDIMASLSYAQADKKPTGILNNTYGWEIDVTGTYKITNNLSYMLGVGYWFVGDFYKGTDNTNSLRDDYLVINKLTLTF